MTVTLRCNLNCRMCLQRDHWKAFSNQGDQELNFNEIKTVIQQTFPKITTIGFSGGELFTRSDMMEILAFAAKRNPVRFATNGVSVTSDMAREFVKMNIRSVLISFDGIQRYHDEVRGVSGAYDRSLQTLENIVKWKRDLKSDFPSLIVNSVFMESNHLNLPDLIKTISRFPINEFGLQMVDLGKYRFNPLDDLSRVFDAPSKVKYSDIDNLRDELTNLLRIAANLKVPMNIKPDATIEGFKNYYANNSDTSAYYCTLPWERIIISPYGDVYPCYMLKMGNVRRHRMLGIWNGPAYRYFRKELRKHRLFPQCAGCCFMKPLPRKLV